MVAFHFFFLQFYRTKAHVLLASSGEKKLFLVFQLKMICIINLLVIHIKHIAIAQSAVANSTVFDYDESD